MRTCELALRACGFIRRRLALLRVRLVLGWWRTQGLQVDGPVHVRGPRGIALGPRCRLGAGSKLIAGPGAVVRLATGCFLAAGAQIRSRGVVEVGPNTTLAENVVVKLGNGAAAQIGNDVWIGQNSIVEASCELTIGNDVILAPYCCVMTADHRFSDRDTLIRQQGAVEAPVRIGNDVWLGSGAKVLKGVNIADGCVIGAGAVVTKDTEPYGIYVGVPARKVGERGRLA